MHYKSEVLGKGGIVARVVAKSISEETKQEIITWELEYPRLIHSELMTHRVFSRNSASSRAIPIEKVIEQVSTNPAKPVHWGKNQVGMQAKEELDDLNRKAVELLWEAAAKEAAFLANAMASHGAHKQIANRIMEPFQFMKVIVTTTEKINFYWLRDHADADPTIAELARCMREADETVKATYLLPGDWHLPYYRDGYWLSSWHHIEEQCLNDALAISSSCCAQVSYRKLDDSLEKARNVFKRLVESEPVHASPFEHAATPVPVGSERVWPRGVTHRDRQGNLWSGNLKSWVQYRQLIPNNVKREVVND